MRRPSLQFYPGDWMSNAKLRRCSESARGAWMDLLCLFHDSDEYGVVRWPLEDVARAAGVKIRLARELADKGVLKGADQGAEPYIFTPRHAGKDGAPVTLVEARDGPLWYCSRMARDEYIRTVRGASTRYSEGTAAPPAPESASPKVTPKVTPKAEPNPAFGDGAAAAAASSSSKQLPAGRLLVKDWRPTHDDMNLARQLRPNLDLDATLAKFTAFHVERQTSKSIRYWRKAWQEWVLHERSAASETRSSVGPIPIGKILAGMKPH